MPLRRNDGTPVADRVTQAVEANVARSGWRRGLAGRRAAAETRLK